MMIMKIFFIFVLITSMQGGYYGFYQGIIIRA
jgi:hypothetical protein